MSLFATCSSCVVLVVSITNIKCTPQKLPNYSNYNSSKIEEWMIVLMVDKACSVYDMRLTVKSLITTKATTTATVGPSLEPRASDHWIPREKDERTTVTIQISVACSVVVKIFYLARPFLYVCFLLLSRVD